MTDIDITSSNNIPSTKSTEKNVDKGNEPASPFPLINYKKHINYFKMVTGILPTALQEYDSIRMTILFFGLSGLDLLNSIDILQNKDKIIDWIYSTQLIDDEKSLKGGFRGCNMGGVFSKVGSTSQSMYDCGHLALTYTALSCLAILGDDFSRIDKKGILSSVGALQTLEGSFLSTLVDGERDMRYVYCACCICYILNDWSKVDRSKIVNFIQKSLTFDFAIGQAPLLEGHGGSTFCGLAALSLMGELENAFPPKTRLKMSKWLLSRQIKGFNGRPNKLQDTCYSFWIGGAVYILDHSKFVSTPDLVEYVLSTENALSGGFAKWPDCTSDPLHSYLGLAGLSLLGYPGLKSLHTQLNITTDAANHIFKLHQQWKQ